MSHQRGRNGSALRLTNTSALRLFNSPGLLYGISEGSFPRPSRARPLPSNARPPPAGAFPRPARIEISRPYLSARGAPRRFGGAPSPRTERFWGREAGVEDPRGSLRQLPRWKIAFARGRHPSPAPLGTLQATGGGFRIDPLGLKGLRLGRDRRWRGWRDAVPVVIDGGGRNTQSK